MNNWILLLSLAVLLAGVFIFQKLWLGALGAVVLLLLLKIFWLSEHHLIFFDLANAVIIWFELIILLFGAYLFYSILSSNNHFIPFTKSVTGISSKISITLILCWFMGSFMEGVAGFGIPALLIAPLMLTVGFKPLTSLILPLASNTTAVLFGALGTPLKIGFGIDHVNDVVIFTLLLNAFPAVLMPFILTYLLSKTEGLKIEWSSEWKSVAGSGICFYIPFVTGGIFSIEFPSVMAGVVGLILFVWIFIPAVEKLTIGVWWKTFYPYVFFVMLLVCWKFIFLDVRVLSLPGIKYVSLYQPGIVFVIAGCGVLFWLVKSKATGHLIPLIKNSFHHIRFPALTIFTLVLWAQLASGLFAVALYEFVDSLASYYQRAIMPFMGISGSFITGSATMSNLVFAGSLTELTLVNQAMFTALLHTGSAIGNAISLQNIIMVKSVVPQDISEAKVLGLNGRVVILYVTSIIAVSFFLTM